MTFQRHQFLDRAIALAMLLAVCVQSIGEVPAVSSVPSVPVQGSNGGGRGNVPGCHCCHGKVFLKLDKRYNLKPLVFLSTPLFQLVAPPVRRFRGCTLVLSGLASVAFRPAGLRGPPRGLLTY